MGWRACTISFLNSSVIIRWLVGYVANGLQKLKAGRELGKDMETCSLFPCLSVLHRTLINKSYNAANKDKFHKAS